MKKKVLVAMSGGVDSSAAAAILVQQGYHVEGATMQLWSSQDAAIPHASTGCCSQQAVDDARRVAECLSIPFHVFDFHERFEEKVISPFVEEYRKGRTPNPCIRCNRYLKFDAFLEKALEMGFDFIATGHYGWIERSEKTGRFLLKTAVNGEKDQSYVLYHLTQKQLSHLLLPVGTRTKPEIRQIAKDAGLPVFNKPDSQEICFIKDNDYASFIEKRGVVSEPGNFVAPDGRVLGRHKGIFHYTVGQRKGLGIALGYPVFVLEIRPDSNEVVLGKNEETFCSELIADDLNFLGEDPFADGGRRCLAKIRYAAPLVDAFVSAEEGGRMRVRFETPVRAATPGQSVVLYDGDTLLGGGTIESVEPIHK